MRFFYKKFHARKSYLRKHIVSVVLGVATLSIVIIGGCATSTGVMPYGQDTFTVMAEGELVGALEARRKALQDANEFCATRNQMFMPVSEETGYDRNPFSGDPVPVVRIVFRCLGEKDPGYHRPTYNR